MRALNINKFMMIPLLTKIVFSLSGCLLILLLAIICGQLTVLNAKIQRIQEFYKKQTQLK